MALSCESPRLAQASTLPYGVPTFLDAANCAAAIQPTPRHSFSLPQQMRVCPNNCRRTESSFSF